MSAEAFADANAVSGYRDNAARLVPGLFHLHRMAGLLLEERVPDDGRVLVLGAGGGLELEAFAARRPGWRMTGVDPSQAMLDLARATLGERSKSVEFITGKIEDAPVLPFDGAVSILTLHFLDPNERLATLRGLYQRLAPGAPLVVAHHSVPREDRPRHLERFAAFAASNGVPSERANESAKMLEQRLPILEPEEDEDLLRAAGFPDITLFYAALTFRGWVATRV